MKPTDRIFDDFVVSKKGKGRTSFKAKLAFKGLEKFGIGGIYLIGLGIAYYIPTGGGAFFLVLKTLAAICIFLVVRKIINKLSTIALFTLDKSNASLSSHLDSFHAKLEDIKAISVIEEAVGGSEEMQYRLRFTLKDGEKTSAFAFTSFDTAEALVKEIKSASEEK
jgi:hypothetical protein